MIDGRNIQVNLSEAEFAAELSYTIDDDGIHVAVAGQERLVGMTPTLEDVISVVHALGDAARASRLDAAAATLQETGCLCASGLSLSEIMQVVETIGVDPRKVRIVGHGITVDE